MKVATKVLQDRSRHVEFRVYVPLKQSKLNRIRLYAGYLDLVPPYKMQVTKIKSFG